MNTSADSLIQAIAEQQNIQKIIDKGYSKMQDIEQEVYDDVVNALTSSIEDKLGRPLQQQEIDKVQNLAEQISPRAKL